MTAISRGWTGGRSRTAASQGRGWVLAAALLVIVLFGGALLMATLRDGEPVDPATNVLTPQDENKAAFTRFITEVWQNGDLALLDDLLADDFVRHEAGSPDVLRADLPGFIEVFRAAVPDGVNTIETISAEGDMVWVRGTFTGTFTGPLPLGPDLIAAPTNAPLVFDLMTSARFVDGRIAEQWVVTDSLSFMAQIGAAQTPDVTLTEARNMATVQALIEEGINQQDESAYERYYVEGLTATHVGNRPTDANDSAGGRQNWIEGNLLWSWPDLHMTVMSIAANGDYVLVQCAAQGTLEHSWARWDGSVAAETNAVEEFSWTYIFRFEDGLIAEEWWYIDFYLFD